MAKYQAAVSEADHMTTRLSMDSRETIEALENMTGLLQHDLGDTVEQLQRLWRDYGNRDALNHLYAIEDRLRSLGRVSSQLDSSVVEADTLPHDEMNTLIARRSLHAELDGGRTGVNIAASLDDMMVD